MSIAYFKISKNIDARTKQNLYVKSDKSIVTL